MERSRQTWRLIDTGPLDGALNMAVDEALLSAFDPTHSVPVFRLYGWDPPALSLGRFQKAEEVLDLERCAAARVPVVRRITGGGAIYHAEELTYSIVCAPQHISAASSIKESFRVLTSFLLGFYRKLGLNPRYAADIAPTGARLGERTPFCFAGKEAFDIVIGGRKIGGNAQRRLRNVIFQHGSIPLLNLAATGVTFLREPTPGIAERTTALRELGVADPPEKLKALAAEAFTEAFGCLLSTGALTPGEQSAAGSCCRDSRNDDGHKAQA